MVKRKGLGKGLGKGYKNIVTRDPFIHGLSAKGVKTSPMFKDALRRVERVRNTLYKKKMDKLAEDLNQAHHSLSLGLEEEGYELEDFYGLDAKGKGEDIPKIKDIMTEDEVKRRYQYELDEGLINTEEEGVPYYDDFNEFKRMMQDMNIKIVDAKGIDVFSYLEDVVIKKDLDDFDWFYSGYSPSEQKKIREQLKTDPYSDSDIDVWRDTGYMKSLTRSLKEDVIGFIMVGEGVDRKTAEKSVDSFLKET